MGILETLVAYKYLIDLMTTLFAMFLAHCLGESGKTTTRSGLIAVIMMNINISLLFIQYSGDAERTKLIWAVVWVIFVIALLAAYKLGKGGLDVSTGTAPGIVRKIGTPLASGVIVFLLYLLVDRFFEHLRPFLTVI